MEKYKVCPSCGKHNAPILIECADCETDLTGIKVVDSQTEQMSNIGPQTAEMIRLCTCGAENPSSARKCAACGEEISDITPTEKSECNDNLLDYALIAIDDDFAFAITQKEHTIGREQEMGEYLSNKTYVSRVHARFSLINNELFITNLSGTNFTYVNNEKIPANTPFLLHDGDEIGLGGFVKDGQRQEGAAYFTARICQCM